MTPLLTPGEQAVAAYKTFRDSEPELWTRAGHIKVRLAKDVDIRRLASLIAWAVLRSS